eukprot:NODE_6954_length_596_cov_4.093236_g5959_i0.p5 GENE.NODE_6954_length_596_cov_4.093236_g5959_i0~~NODE_6954_length_596_cov_4.093236_g5959_i0.p5  ORF type:complete len:62 (-),score=0.07 NODE_6954_length_596_cov_4.093236_g5959_i0:81-266(-)
MRLGGGHSLKGTLSVCHGHLCVPWGSGDVEPPQHVLCAEPALARHCARPPYEARPGSGEVG